MKIRMPDRVEYWIGGTVYLTENHQHKAVSVPLTIQGDHLFVCVSAEDTAIDYTVEILTGQCSEDSVLCFHSAPSQNENYAP